jgi:hypothetical protein
MKQLKKNIEVSPTDELVDLSCGDQKIGVTCVCDGSGNKSIEDEDEIIF